jgi:hypothetical protein
VPKVVQQEREASPRLALAGRTLKRITSRAPHVSAMSTEAVRFLVLWMAGWINFRQLVVIDFLREENCVLREQLSWRRLGFTDDQRR